MRTHPETRSKAEQNGVGIGNSLNLQLARLIFFKCQKNKGRRRFRINPEHLIKTLFRESVFDALCRKVATERHKVFSYRDFEYLNQLSRKHDVDYPGQILFDPNQKVRNLKYTA